MRSGRVARGIVLGAVAWLAASGVAGAQTNLVTVKADCVEAGRARYGIEVRNDHSGPVSGTVKSTATGETLNTYEVEANGTVRTGAPVGEKRLTFVSTSGGVTDTDMVEAQDCGATTTISPAAGTSTPTTAATTPTTVGQASHVATPASTPTPAPALTKTALAATGSQAGYWMQMAAASFMLGLLCMFVTQRQRYRRIDAWLSYVFNNF